MWGRCDSKGLWRRGIVGGSDKIVNLGTWMEADEGLSWSPAPRLMAPKSPACRVARQAVRKESWPPSGGRQAQCIAFTPCLLLHLILARGQEHLKEETWALRELLSFKTKRWATKDIGNSLLWGWWLPRHFKSYTDFSRASFRQEPHKCRTSQGSQW